jgi:uncharacterized protein involved in exopolysaccharide biosynthesis
MAMSLQQYLRVIWARKWLVLLLFVATSIIGSAIVLSMPKVFVAEASLVVDGRPDPLSGPMAQPIDMATQIEVLKSDKVAIRAVQILGMDKDPKAREQWLQSTEGKKVPLERYFASMLQRGMSAEPVRLSSVVTVGFTSVDSAFAATAANAFAQAAIDTSVEMKTGPAKESAALFETRLKELQGKYEEAQARLTKYQQEKGIIITDGQMSQEEERLNQLNAQLTTAQAEASGMGSGGAVDSAAVQSIRNQIAAEEAKLNGSAGIWGPNHPERLAAQSRISSLKQQERIEAGRAGAGEAGKAAIAARKVTLLRKDVEEQKKKVLSIRYERDQASVLLRDVSAAQSAYEQAGKVVIDQISLGSTQNSNLRWLTKAVEPYARSNKKMIVGLAASVAGGLLLGILAAIGLELRDRRVRGAEDMTFMYGVPVIGVLHPEGSKQPTFRQLSLGPQQHDPHKPPAMPLLGAR